MFAYFPLLISSIIRSPWSGKFDCLKPLRLWVSVDTRGTSSSGTSPVSRSEEAELVRLAGHGNFILIVLPRSLPLPEYMECREYFNGGGGPAKFLKSILVTPGFGAIEKFIS